jgi:BirA family biotin operon repressor/biotin-[acetyl-CoA-carboxylase] ligase
VVSKYADLDRPPLSEANLRRALQRDFWTDIRVVAETGSTNADVAALAAEGAPEGLALVAEYQGSGRGRCDRTWVSPPRAGISVSMLLRPQPVPVPRWGWLSLLAGVAAARAVREITDISVGLKWPNDLLTDAGKVAGILAEAQGQAVVVGIGLNVTNTAAELPERAGLPASSLRLSGAASTDRDTILRALLRAVAEDYRDWRDAQGDPEASGLRVAYRGMCRTIGQRVSVELPTGRTLDGEATDIDVEGRLVVRAADGSLTPVAAGDVTHVRPS